MCGCVSACSSFSSPVQQQADNSSAVLEQSMYLLLDGSIGCWRIAVHNVTWNYGATATGMTQLIICEDSWGSSLSLTGR